MKIIKHKFHAKPCETDGIKFSSQLERNYYVKLNLLKKAGEIVFFLMQVPFRLPAGIKYVVDFVVFWADGSVEFVDTTGVMTPMKILKIKQVEELYPVIIKIVKS